METLKGKVIITGKIETLTGLHIGGSSSTLDIGGIDLNVIKTADGIPFIPGSSLKGKLRSLLAREEGSDDVRKDSAKIQRIFGIAGDQNERSAATRLITRDAFLDEKAFADTFGKDSLEFGYTEGKWENTINRVKGSAEHPRQLERVPAGAVFCFEMVYDIYSEKERDEDLKTIRKAMQLLEDDYLGGSGSRGYGKVKFRDLKIELRDLKKYYENSDPDNDFTTLSNLFV